MAKSLVEVMDEIQQENPSYKEEDIKNAVNSAHKQYLPNLQENLTKIKEEALATLNFSAKLDNPPIPSAT